MTLVIPDWEPPWPVKGPARFVRVTSRMTRGRGCAEQTARKARPDQYPAQRAPKVPYGPASFPLGLVRDAALALFSAPPNEQSAAERIRTAVIDVASTARDEWAPESVVAAEAGLVGYLEVLESLRASGDLPDTMAFSDMALVHESDDERVELWAWAVHHVSRDGSLREVHLLRWQRAQDVPLDPVEVAFIAHVGAAGAIVDSGSGWWSPFQPSRAVTQPPPATTVRVRVIGVLDASSDLRFNGTPQEAADRFDESVPGALGALAGGAFRPSRDCASCNVRYVCPGVPTYPGLLGVTGYSPYIRALSPSDLWTHRACPRQLHLTKDLGLPRERHAPSDALLRGTAVHEWLNLAHERGVPCTQADLDPTSGLHRTLEWNDDQIATNLPYLHQHLRQCPLSDEGVERILGEVDITAFDSDANVIFSTRPDCAYLAADGRWVLRETKTLRPRNLPDDPNELLDRYPQVAAAICLLADGYRPDTQPQEGPGRVELELLGPDASRVLTFDAADPRTVLAARTALADRVDRWLFDGEHPIGEKPPCATCEVVRWCGQQPDGALEAATVGLELPAPVAEGDWDVHAPDIVLRDLMGVASPDEEFPF